MKKGQIVEAIVEKVDFPNKGIARVLKIDDVVNEDTGLFVTVKNTIAGQKIRVLINKIKHKKAEGRVLEIIEKAPIEVNAKCPHFGQCGGCTFLNLPYDLQLEMKKNQVQDILDKAVDDEAKPDYFEGIKASPISYEYRNKMEFSFGDAYKDGPLALGMHKRGSFYDIVTVTDCQLVHNDYREILKTTLEYFEKTELTYYHRVRHEGYLRHLLVRRGVKTGEILVDIVTTTQIEAEYEKKLLDGWKDALLNSEIEGKFAGILHTKNDSLADVVKDDGTDILYGQDYFYEELLDLRFKITPFSFFQTNSLGAQVLYETAREYAITAMNTEANQDSDKKPVIFDLYSGTGTIGQMMSPVADHVIGIEIIEEAVEAAKINAQANGLHNCTFLAGDVLKVIDSIDKPEDQPDLIILDPPRDGCHPKTLPKILAYNAPNIVYISCKITSLARDLEMLQGRGYKVQRAVVIDQFPWTGNVETICLLSKK